MRARAYRAFDKISNKMFYPKDLEAIGVAMFPDGTLRRYMQDDLFINVNDSLVALYDTGMVTPTGERIWEADIVDCDVQFDLGGIVSNIKDRGVVLWDDQRHQWFIKLTKKPLFDGLFSANNINVVGNIYQHKELIQHEKQT